MSAQEAAPDRGLSVREVAARYRVGPARVRAWVREGKLAAVAVERGRGVRLVFTREALAAFELARRPVPAEPEKPKRRRRPSCPRDYYPD